MIMQMKLKSGEELIGRHVGGSEYRDMLLIERVSNPVYNDDGEVIGTQVYFTMKSWFVNQFEGDPDKKVKMSDDALMAVTFPSEEVVAQFESTVKYLKRVEDETEDEEDPSEDIPFPSPVSGRLN